VAAAVSAVEVQGVAERVCAWGPGATGGGAGALVEAAETRAVAEAARATFVAARLGRAKQVWAPESAL